MHSITLDDYDYIIKSSEEIIDFLLKHYKPVDFMVYNGQGIDWTKMIGIYEHFIIKDNYIQPMASFALLYPTEALRFITIEELKQDLRKKKIRNLDA